MNLQQKIAAARTRSGLTQDELAERCGISTRTIQRIESGTTLPRSFTLKAIATALNIPFDELNEGADTPVTGDTKLFQNNDPDADRHFLQMLCLSCFTYLLIPYLHFLVPYYLLKKEGATDSSTLSFARSIIKGQIYWVIGNTVILLLALAFNLTMKAYQQNTHISYLIVFFASYIANAVIIYFSYRKIPQPLAETSL